MPKTRAAASDIPPELAIDAATVTDLLVDFVRRETRRAGFRRAVVGLSGGIDSATSAALAARALGPRNVLCLLLPYRTSSPDSLRDARRLARLLRTPTERFDISPMVDACYRRDTRASRRRRGNTMARVRMTLLYDRSMRDERLVIGTSNKTELLLGYGTHFGDMASALNPLGDLYKTQVRVVAQRLGVPDAILRKTPTADLWAGQSDEEELGHSYSDLDRLLLRLVEMRDSPENAIARGFPRRMVDDVRRRLVGSQFKRRPPVIAKLTRRAINVDFRYARDWGS